MLGMQELASADARREALWEWAVERAARRAAVVGLWVACLINYALGAGVAVLALWLTGHLR